MRKAVLTIKRIGVPHKDNEIIWNEWIDALESIDYPLTWEEAETIIKCSPTEPMEGIEWTFIHCIENIDDSEKIDGFTVHTYNGKDLIACFDKNISEDVIKIIANRQPTRAVFRDSSFENSSGKINVVEIFKMLAPDTSVKII